MRGLGELAGALRAHRLLHLDAHFRDILTDGHRLHLTDFGLSLGAGFPMTDDEREFVARHVGYDRVYTAYHVVIWLVTALRGLRGEECAGGRRPEGVPRVVGELLVRYGPLADRMEGFVREFGGRSRRTPYPAEELDRLYSRATLSA